MSFKNYDEEIPEPINDPETDEDDDGELPLGWHTLQIIDVDVFRRNGKRLIHCVVKCISPSAHGAVFGVRHDDGTIKNCLSGYFETSWYPAFCAACKCYSHNPNVMLGDELSACFMGKVFRAELKTDDDSKYQILGRPKLRILGWPKRPNSEQREACDEYVDLELLRKHDEDAKAYSAQSEFREYMPGTKEALAAARIIKPLINAVTKPAAKAVAKAATPIWGFDSAESDKSKDENNQDEDVDGDGEIKITDLSKIALPSAAPAKLPTKLPTKRPTKPLPEGAEPLSPEQIKWNLYIEEDEYDHFEYDYDGEDYDDGDPNSIWSARRKRFGLIPV